jgi:hypothetical protein
MVLMSSSTAVSFARSHIADSRLWFADAGGQVDRGVVTGFGRDAVNPCPAWIATQKRGDVATVRSLQLLREH